MPATQEHIRRRCNRCGYDLGASLESPTCPECGTPIEVAAAKRRFLRPSVFLSLGAGLLMLGWFGVGVLLMQDVHLVPHSVSPELVWFILWALTLPLIALVGIVVSVVLFLMRRRVGKTPFVIWVIMTVLVAAPQVFIYFLL